MFGTLCISLGCIKSLNQYTETTHLCLIYSIIDRRRKLPNNHVLISKHNYFSPYLIAVIDRIKLSYLLPLDVLVIQHVHASIPFKSINTRFYTRITPVSTSINARCMFIQASVVIFSRTLTIPLQSLRSANV